jgi:hypothetical protein
MTHNRIEFIKINLNVDNACELSAILLSITHHYFIDIVLLFNLKTELPGIKISCTFYFSVNGWMEWDPLVD